MGHTLFYDGDILMYYAELGLILAAFRKLPPKGLLLLAALLLLAFPIERAVTSLRKGRPEGVAPPGWYIVLEKRCPAPILEIR